MTSIRRFKAEDLFKFNAVNLDPLTETYNLRFYYDYMSQWPEYFQVAVSPHDKKIMGYIMGKVEGEESKEEWHGHVTAVTVGPEFRRIGLARRLMRELEYISEKMYKNFGYSIYRRVLKYYSGAAAVTAEDAFDMRMALPRDKARRTIVPKKAVITPEELEW